MTPNPCQTGGMASAEYMRQWRANKAKAEGRQPGKVGKPPTAEHGTRAAYKRHLRNDETPCQACRDANAAYHAERRAAREGR